MANPQLVAYIKQNLAQFPKETLIQSLAASGWQAPDISEAFTEIEHPAPAPVVPPAPVVVPPPVVAPVVVTPAPVVPSQPVAAPVQPIQVAPAVPVQPVAVAPIQPIQVIPPVAAQPAPTDFLAEMEKRRGAAEAAHPFQNVTVGAAPTTPRFKEAAESDQKGIIGMLIKMKLAKNEQQANIVMIGIVIVCIGISAWFLWPSSPSSSPPPPLTPPVTTPPTR